MCDLIDLNSPDVNGLPDLKLASPLIPIPKDNSNDERANPLATLEKRESLGSNPFDNALRETAEYVSRKGDPFEMVLQRALKRKGKKDNLKTHSLDLADDFTPKRRGGYRKAMNRTLDESLIVGKADVFRVDSGKPVAKLVGESVTSDDTNNAGDTRDNDATKGNTNVSSVPDARTRKIRATECVNALELSILNQSAMNDTLLDVDFRSKKDDETSSLPQKDMLFKEFIFAANNDLGPPNLRRSESHRDARSPTRELRCLGKRSQSTADASRTALRSDSSAVSSYMDKGFLQAESKQSEQSAFSNLSNVSSITRLNSVLFASNLSSPVSSNGTMNHAFLDSGSLKMSRETLSTTESTVEMKSVQYDLSDLAEKLSKLKCVINNVPSSTLNEIDESNPTNEDNNKEIINDKLIDVDLFLPEPNFSREHNKSTTSTSSSDSVFTSNSKTNKSILNEAKALARTFEELALKTDSGSSMDDLISNNTLWLSELLPAFEDEAVVNNLIELPVSPKEAIEDTKDNDTKQSPNSINNMEENSMKETEPQFTNCVSAVRETAVTKLLLDLKKLIKPEDNSEARKLIDNLEKVLGIECKSNTELLATCFNISNELRTPELSNDKSISDEQSDKLIIDKSQEESKKESSEENGNNNEKSSLYMNRKSESTSQASISSDNSTKVSPYKDNSEDRITNSHEIALNTSYNNEKSNQSDEKLAVELLVNLGKLLNGQTEDAATLRLLKNIGKALNIASNNLKIENESQTDSKTHNMRQTTPVKRPKSEQDAHWLVATEATHERSFDLKSKSSETKTKRRSLSVIHSPVKTTTNAQINKHKGALELNDLKKRFSSDPELTNTVANKKTGISEVYRMKKAGTANIDSKKEKSLPIIDVKNKLKRKSDIVNKKGPMKALHPVGVMQKRVGKQTTQFSQATTPPKSSKAIGSKLISSTPNSMGNDHIPKKTTKSKPMASSTPDSQHFQVSSAQLVSVGSCKKRNFSCDISPVTTYVNSNNNNGRKDSPRRSNKLSTPKKCTPKHQQTDSSGIPKYLMSPKRHNTSLDMNHQSLLESPQYLSKSLTGHQRYSPICQKKSAEKILHSPLKDSNKITKVKPFKLISKFKRHSMSDIEKENNYV